MIGHIRYDVNKIHIGRTPLGRFRPFGLSRSSKFQIEHPKLNLNIHRPNAKAVDVHEKTHPVSANSHT